MRDIFKNHKIFDIDAKKLRSKDFFKNKLEYREKIMEKYKDLIKSPSEFKCLLCGSLKGSLYLKYKDYPLIECEKCQLVSPNIKLESLGGLEVYDDESYIKYRKQETLRTYDYRKKTYATERLSYILEKIKNISEKDMKLLDVGCGPGYFISYLKDRGIESKGLELSDFLVELCKEMGLNVEKADLENEKDNHYNVITLFDVLEHLTDPVSLFKTMNDKLVSGGYVLAFNPNIHSLAFYLQGGLQNTLLPFQHLCFFDETSLKYLAKKTGFRIYSIDYYGLDVMDYFYMKQYQDGVDYHDKLKEFIPVVQAIVDKQGLSNHMRIIFQKKDK